MKRYLTSGVNEKVPIQIQLFCWNEYDKCNQNQESDYLHIFKIETIQEVDVYKLKIVHEQEQPLYSCSYQINWNSLIDVDKIYIISQDDYEIMLLAEEY